MNKRNDREAILQSDNSIVVSAGAGSGKTTILIKKIIDEISKNRTHYKIAAITFTTKAANEIKTRLQGKHTGNFIGTNDSFVECEIIRPFLKDAYGSDYNNEFNVTYAEEKFDTYDKGLEILKKKNLLASYKDNKKNFKFQLALNILKKSKVAKQYIIARYSRLYIDEYQDCDTDMHNLFMYINQIGVKLFIVGDIKQSIYVWRGANPEQFKKLVKNNTNFDVFQLKENYRCCQDIQNYSNVLEFEDSSYYVDNGISNDVIGVSDNEDYLKYLDMNEEVAILVRTNKQAENLKDELNSLGYDFIFIPRNPLDDIGTSNKNILIELAKYIENSRYTHFDFINNIPGEFDKKEKDKLKQIICGLKENQDKSYIEDVLIELFKYVGLSFNETKEIDSFIEAVINTKYENSFNGKEFKHRIITVHSAKGLEFKQVVIFSKDYQIYRNKDKQEHYVATTRAEDKLIICLNDEYYLKYIQSICKKTNINIDQIINIF